MQNFMVGLNKTKNSLKKNTARDHQTLLKKLYHCGFQDKILDILKSYLENRKMCIISNKNKSEF